MKTRFLQFDDIIFINELSIEQHGGNFVPPQNLLHEEALRYLVDVVDAELFGAPMYPSFADKAAVYMFNIISNHVFSDGNKRTGLEAALLFLRMNGFTIGERTLAGEKIKNSFLHNFTIQVASGQHDLDAVRAWFTEHLQTLIN